MLAYFQDRQLKYWHDFVINHHQRFTSVFPYMHGLVDSHIRASASPPHTVLWSVPFQAKKIHAISHAHSPGCYTPPFPFNAIHIQVNTDSHSYVPDAQNISSYHMRHGRHHIQHRFQFQTTLDILFFKATPHIHHIIILSAISWICICLHSPSTSGRAAELAWSRILRARRIAVLLSCAAESRMGPSSALTCTSSL